MAQTNLFQKFEIDGAWFLALLLLLLLGFFGDSFADDGNRSMQKRVSILANFHAVRALPAQKWVICWNTAIRWKSH